jgi:hypothetical protein
VFVAVQDALLDNDQKILSSEKAGSKNQANPLKRRGRLAGVFHALSRAAP